MSETGYWRHEEAISRQRSNECLVAIRKGIWCQSPHWFLTGIQCDGS